MKLSKIKSIILTGAVAAISVMSGHAAGQTVANGPYYATPSWDQTLPPATRFITLSNFNNKAILDRETGLVWSTMGDFITTTSDPTYAQMYCLVHALDRGRKGWRLPTYQELATLIAGDEIALFPFASDSPGIYTSTRPFDDPTKVFVLSRQANHYFFYPARFETINWSGVNPAARIYCVRSPD